MGGVVTRHPPADFLAQLARCAARGLGRAGIAKAFGAEKETVDRWLEQMPQARAILEAVRECVPIVTHRPEKQPSPDAAQLITLAAAKYPKMKLVARKAGVSVDTFRRWLKEHRELAEAFEAGKADHEMSLIDTLDRDAKDGEKPNINAIVLGKVFHGWREGDQGEQPSRINITFNLPGAMTREHFEKSVVATQESRNG
jgi:transposase